MGQADARVTTGWASINKTVKHATNRFCINHYLDYLQLILAPHPRFLNDMGQPRWRGHVNREYQAGYGAYHAVLPVIVITACVMGTVADLTQLSAGRDTFASGSETRILPLPVAAVQ